MLHYGRTPQGELELRATGHDIAALYRMLLAAPLQERRTFYGLKAMIEEQFRDALTAPVPQSHVIHPDKEGKEAADAAM